MTKLEKHRFRICFCSSLPKFSSPCAFIAVDIAEAVCQVPSVHVW